MANSLDQDLLGKVVVLSKDYLKPEWHDLKKRLFKVAGGFGASPHTIGGAIFGEFLFDGEKCRMEGYQVERLATEAEVKEAQS